MKHMWQQVVSGQSALEMRMKNFDIQFLNFVTVKA